MYTDANGIVMTETTDNVAPLQTLLNTLQTGTSTTITGLKSKQVFLGTGSPSPASVGQRWYDTATGDTAIAQGAFWIGAGGQVINNYISSNQGPVGAGAAMAITAAAVTITPGRWKIECGASMRTVGAQDAATLGVYNASAGSEVAGYRGTSATSPVAGTMSIRSYPLVIFVSTSTVYCPIMFPNGGSTLQCSADAGGKSAWIRAERY